MRQGRFRLGENEKNTVKEVRHWYRLPRELLESLSLEMLMRCLDLMLDDLV